MLGTEAAGDMSELSPSSLGRADSKTKGLQQEAADMEVRAKVCTSSSLVLQSALMADVPPVHEC